jgi:GNAT superfamily N-acetyltransferase
MTSVIEVQAPSALPPGVSEVTVLRAAGPDAAAVLAMLGRCSRASLFHRFHGFSDGAAYFTALLRDQPAGQTLLAWSGSACVGVGTLGVGATGIVDLGVLVEDAWQRRGIGTRLMTSLLDGARAGGVTAVHADVLADDVFMLGVLRRAGPLRVSIESGSFSVDVDLSSQPGAADSANGLSLSLPLHQWFSIPPAMTATLLRRSRSAVTLRIPRPGSGRTGWR